jgi:ArsC family
MRSNLLKHNNLMLRSEQRERLEAWAASDSPISHSQTRAGRSQKSDEELIAFMLAHPILIDWPIVVTPKGTKLCRPSEAVLELLDHPSDTFVKEDGEIITGNPSLV